MAIKSIDEVQRTAARFFMWLGYAAAAIAFAAFWLGVAAVVAWNV